MAAPLLYDKPGALMHRTYKLLKADGRTVEAISRDTGISFYWLTQFSAKMIKNPSVNRVEYLYEKLSGKKLNLN